MSAPNARALFAAAREDGPDAVERDAVFRKIALATGIARRYRRRRHGTLARAGDAGRPQQRWRRGNAASAATAASGAATWPRPACPFGMKLLALGVALGAVSTALGVLLAVTLVITGDDAGPRRAAQPRSRPRPRCPARSCAA